MKRLYELHGEGRSIREIARILGISRNTVRRYLRATEVPKPAPRATRGSKLDPYKAFILQRVAEGVENCVVLLRELRIQGYEGSYTILKEFVRPLRRPRSIPGTVRFETQPGMRRKWIGAAVPIRCRTARSGESGSSRWCSAGHGPCT
ncbi:helix-turn-helix domain-containing protein [Hydrogenibacillus sp. N12]|nr:helix-turn-helix domain-containing protein [Hydrogenibacillus sp. N12]